MFNAMLSYWPSKQEDDIICRTTEMEPDCHCHVFTLFAISAAHCADTNATLLSDAATSLATPLSFFKFIKYKSIVPFEHYHVFLPPTPQQFILFASFVIPS